MKVTYIGHSGFMLEWNDCYWLFDYYEGNIPTPSTPKPLYVFSSHSHSDHFNPAIFSIAGFSKICYILSHDIMGKAKKHKTPANTGSIHFMKAREQLILSVEGTNKELNIQTLPSTDCGVAFLLHYEEKWIYHAGDLNWWVWPGESKQYNNNMTANFKKYTAPLKGLDIFAAFLPLDPRQEDWYSKGFLYILEQTNNIKYVFPMHFWKDYSVIQKFINSQEGHPYQKQIQPVAKEGQTFLCTE